MIICANSFNSPHLKIALLSPTLFLMCLEGKNLNYNLSLILRLLPSRWWSKLARPSPCAPPIGTCGTHTYRLLLGHQL